LASLLTADTLGIRPEPAHPAQTDDSLWVTLDSILIGPPIRSLWSGLCLDPNLFDFWVTTGLYGPDIYKRHLRTGSTGWVFRGQGQGPCDIVVFSDSLCLVTAGVDSFFIYDSLGNRARAFASPLPSPSGVDWDGTRLWAASAGPERQVFLMLPSGTLSRTLTWVGVRPDSMGVVELDHTVPNRFWLCRGTGAADNVYYCAFDTVAGNYRILRTFSHSCVVTPGGLAFDGPVLGGSVIYVVDQGGHWLWWVKVHAPLSHDLGVNRIARPTVGETTGSVPVVFSVVNLGQSSADQGSVRALIQDSLGNIVYQDSQDFVSLAPGESLVFTLTQWNAVAGNYLVTAQCIWPGDSFPANDTRLRRTQVSAPSLIWETADRAAGRMRLDVSGPNPLSQGTHVSWFLPAPAPMTLKLYNTMGRLVRTLFHSRARAGTSSLTVPRSALRAGVYVLRLASGGRLVQQKLVVE
jgi:hypothetical protein